MKQEKGSVPVMVIIIAVLVILGLIGIMYLKTSRSESNIPTSNGTSDLAPTNLKGDINRDGRVDSQDADLIKKASPCNHVDPCWKKVVGKTKDGDNPIYTSDLDLNHDDNVNELDISAMSVGQ